MYVSEDRMLNVSLQWITIPAGESLINLTPFLSKNEYSDNEDRLLFYKNNDRVICERRNWSVQVFETGNTVEEAKENSSIATKNESPGIYFSDSNGLSWMVRNLMEVEVISPEIPDTEKWEKFNISYTEVGYVAGTKILVKNNTWAFIFEYSGDEYYPLGEMLWGQNWLNDSVQYLGNNNYIEADSVLVWRLNDLTINAVLDL